MRIAYYDESGDDGYPAYSSELFSLSVLYLHYLNWKDCYGAVAEFRRTLKVSFGIPVKTEFHTKYFLLNKNPYKPMGLSDSQRIQVIDLFCDLIGTLQVKIINVVIVKPLIVKPDYEVLDTALKFSIQRIENDLDPVNRPEERFLIITDSGRVGKMRKTSRRMQRINFIPSKFTPTSYRQEIQSLIEDPLPKDSKESYFIQLSDIVAYVVYLYAIHKTGFGKYSNRLPVGFSPSTILNWMDRLKPSLNLLASGKDDYGVVFHPQK